MGKIRMPADLLPDALPVLSIDGELGIFHHDNEVRIARGDLNARYLHASRNGHDPWRESWARPCRSSLRPQSSRLPALHRYGTRASPRRFRSPAHRPPCAPIASAIHAATQRVPLPLISAIDPSALCRRMRPVFGPVHAKNSTPSAPMPVLRAQRRRVRSAQSRPFAASSVTIRKSLPQAWALVNEINLPPE